MTHIPIMVKVIDEVVSDATMERTFSNKVITSCFDCGGIYFYQIVEHIIGTQIATDPMIYCCQCGQLQGGRYDDPGEELDEQMRPKKKVSSLKGIEVNIALIKMLKAIDNDIRYLIVARMLNSPPMSRTYIHNLVIENRGETSKGFISYHLDILTQSAVVEEIQEDEYTFYRVTPESVRTLKSLGLIEMKEVEE